MTPRLEAALGELAEAIRQEVRAELRDVAGAPDKMLSVIAAAEAAGVGRSLMYHLIGSGQVRSIRVGGRRLIPSSAIAELAQPPPELGK